MNSIALISREPKLRRVLSKYLKGRKEFQSSYVSYDDAIESLDLSSTEILIVDIQGIPRGQTAISIRVLQSGSQNLLQLNNVLLYTFCVKEYVNQN